MLHTQNKEANSCFLLTSKPLLIPSYLLEEAARMFLKVSLPYLPLSAEYKQSLAICLYAAYMIEVRRPTLSCCNRRNEMCGWSVIASPRSWANTDVISPVRQLQHWATFYSECVKLLLGSWNKLRNVLYSNFNTLFFFAVLPTTEKESYGEYRVRQNLILCRC